MISFHPEAVEELKASVFFYENQKPGLGGRFITNVEKALERIQKHPSAWSLSSTTKSPVRRYFLAGFPFGLIYKVNNGDIRIMAVMHLSRKPGYWNKRRER
jgi:hypothetical protein